MNPLLTTSTLTYIFIDIFKMATTRAPRSCMAKRMFDPITQPLPCNTAF